MQNGTIASSSAYNAAIGVVDHATLQLVNMTVSAAGGDGLLADYGGQIFSLDTIFSVNSAADMHARRGGKIHRLGAGETKEGNMRYHELATEGGEIDIDTIPDGGPFTVTLGSGVNAWIWAVAGQGGILNEQGESFDFAGFSVTGYRVSEGSGATIYTGTGIDCSISTFFPGSIAGNSSGSSNNCH